MKKIFLALIFALTIAQVQAETGVYRISLNKLNFDIKKPIESEEIPKSNLNKTLYPECYDPVNIGSVGSVGICEDLLIVDNVLITKIVKENGAFTDINSVRTDWSLDDVFTGQVTSLDRLFDNNAVGDTMLNFNEDIGYWDTSGVTTMRFALAGLSVFNQDVSSWDVSNVTDMYYLFGETPEFNQPLNSWDVSNVENFGLMFLSASAFNQPLDSWNVSRAFNKQPLYESEYNGMFGGASSFNQDLSAWDVSKWKNLSYMFYASSSFDQDLSSWAPDTYKPDIFAEDSAPDFANNTLKHPKWKALIASASCEDSSNVGNVGQYYPCQGKLIVDNILIREVVASNGSYTDANSVRTDWSADDLYTGQVTDLSYLFYKKPVSDDIGYWDVSNVTDMEALFSYSNFNGNINDWDVSNVTNMKGIFFYNKAYNQPLNKWDVSNVTNAIPGIGPMAVALMDDDISQRYLTENSMSVNIMFFHATNFNQDLSSWDISKLTTMYQMFDYSAFNYDIGGWNTSSVTDMAGALPKHYNYDISSWNTSNVRNMANLFGKNKMFNYDLSSWDVSKVEYMNEMFFGSVYSHSLNNWDVSKVKDMRGMFKLSVYDKPLNNWNVSKVQDMSNMFEGSNFSQDISSWNTMNVEDMSWMFSNIVREYTHDLSGWNVDKVTNHNQFRDAFGYNENSPVWKN